MKTGVVVAAVGAAFGAGILTTVLLLQPGTPPTSSPANAGGGGAASPRTGAPRDVHPDLAAGPAGATATPAQVAPAGGGDAPPPPPPAAPGAPPPPPPPEPPPPSPELLREGELAAREQPQEKGNGQVTHLVYEFDSEEERQAWEASRKTSWATRLAREREIKLKIMREQVGLTAGQEPRLVQILETEAAERQRLVDALAAKEISRTSFDQQAKANLEKARAALAALLTPQQLEAFNQLKPREQVLRDETH